MPYSWNINVRGDLVLPLINSDAEIIRVEAGPGTGKTFGLVRRVERLLHPQGLGLPGGEVLVVAFNRVIAKQLNMEIGERLSCFPHEGEPVIRTVHALCLQVIGSFPRIVLDHERVAMIYDLLCKYPPLRELYETHRKADQALRNHEAKHEEHSQLWAAARGWLVQHEAILISDLPGLLLDHMEGGDFLTNRFSHVIVDEFQDLTSAEQKLFFRLKKPDGQLVVLGDPRQSIYAFRGNDREGLAKIDELAEEYGGSITDLPMNECHRCPATIVGAANRLMGLSGALAMIPKSNVNANTHIVVWNDPDTEAIGMARAIVDNYRAYHNERHLVMVTRRHFGYLLRDKIFTIDPTISVDLNFSESLLETWSVREAFLFFSLLGDPDRPSWRAWLGYKNSTNGGNFKASKRNAEAYLQFLYSCRDSVTEAHVARLAAEPRDQRRGEGGTYLWDRASRFIQLRDRFEFDPLNLSETVDIIFAPAVWINEDTINSETATLDLQLLVSKAKDIAQEIEEESRITRPELKLRELVRQLRYHIATREPFSIDGERNLEVATLWGAKGVTAEHVYILGACEETIPGKKREEYPGTELEFIDEQKRLFYVSITRTKRTLVLSRPRFIGHGEACQLGFAIGSSSGTAVTLHMSRFYREISSLFPHAVEGEVWGGCIVT